MEMNGVSILASVDLFLGRDFLGCYVLGS
jgi:hypothetical protein